VARAIPAAASMIIPPVLMFLFDMTAPTMPSAEEMPKPARTTICIGL
jgi:hypothetical protein